MRTIKVTHERLPGIGDRFDLTARSGVVVTVVSERSGRQHLSIGPHDAEAAVTVVLTRGEAAAVASLLVGAHAKLIPRPKS